MSEMKRSERNQNEGGGCNRRLGRLVVQPTALLTARRTRIQLRMKTWNLQTPQQVDMQGADSENKIKLDDRKNGEVGRREFVLG